MLKYIERKSIHERAKQMFKRNSRNIDKIIYENEIERLTKERNEYMSKYEIANQYKAQYEELVQDYQRKNRELEDLKKETVSLNEELKTVVDNLKKKFG